MQDGLEGDAVVLRFPYGLSCFQPVSSTQNTQSLWRALPFNLQHCASSRLSPCLSGRRLGVCFRACWTCVSRKYLLTVASIHDGSKLNIWHVSHCSDSWPGFSVFFPQVEKIELLDYVFRFTARNSVFSQSRGVSVKVPVPEACHSAVIAHS